jgi:hypothetical protein
MIRVEFLYNLGNNTGCFKKSFTNLKAYRNLYRGHTQCFELSKCSTTHRALPRIVIRNCFEFFFRFLLPHYQWKSHWTITIRGKTRCVLLYFDSLKRCVYPVYKFLYAFKFVKLFLKHTVFLIKCFISS